MTGLTTHILDLMHGQPASGVKIDLHFLDTVANERKFIHSIFTNEDGRCDTPLLVSKDMTIGNYELLFYIGDYFRSKKIHLPSSPFFRANSDSLRHCHS